MRAPLAPLLLLLILPAIGGFALLSLLLNLLSTGLWLAGGALPLLFITTLVIALVRTSSRWLDSCLLCTGLVKPAEVDKDAAAAPQRGARKGGDCSANPGERE